MKALEKRFEVCAQEQRNEEWLWSEVKFLVHWKPQTPKIFSSQEKTQWAKEKKDGLIEKHYHAIQARLRPDANLMAAFSDGELFFSIDSFKLNSEPPVFLRKRFFGVQRIGIRA